MKKTALLLICVFVLSGCSKKANIDELISAYELPEYSNPVEIEVSVTDEAETDSGDVISIE